MTLEATGPRGVAMLSLHRMASASATFQTRAKLQTQGEAEKRIHLPWQEADEAPLPCAVIMHPDGGGLVWYLWTGGQGNYLRPRGTLQLKLIDRIAWPDDQDRSEIDFVNFCDGVLSDIAELAGVSDWLSIKEIRETLPPSSTHPADRTEGGPPPFFHAVYDVDWDSV